MKQSAKRPLWRRILAGIGGTLLTILLLAVFYVTVVLGQPQKDLESSVDLTQPLRAPSPAIELAAGQPLDEVIAAFPVPVLCCAPGGALTMIGGTSYDTAFESGVARITSLRYQNAQGDEVQAVSIYPARALSLLAGDGWRLVGAGPALAGTPSVQMTKGDTVRLHAQSTDGLYAVTTRVQDADVLQELLRPLQLLGDGRAE